MGSTPRPTRHFHGNCCQTEADRYKFVGGGDVGSSGPVYNDFHESFRGPVYCGVVECSSGPVY